MESGTDRSDGCMKQVFPIVDSMGIVVEGNVSEFRFVGRVPEQVCPVVGSSISQEEVSDHCHMPSPIVQAVHPSAESPERRQPVAVQ